MRENEKIVTLESYYDPMLAEIIRGRLEANGIPCFIADGITIGVNPLYNQLLGGVKIKVFERDLERCQIILTESENTNSEETSQVDTICPYCSSGNVRYGSATERKINLITSIISLILMIYPFYARKAWHCFNCGKDFN
ncbi:MAG: DUF2007 domain-containing protein [Sphingobacteriaceae bacterium]|nr:MAG: DUF2007 domain-containing protein [Sphingobacteriaceae bacterium]